MENAAQHPSPFPRPSSEVTLSQNSFPEGPNSNDTTATHSSTSSFMNAGMEKDIEKDAAMAGHDGAEATPPSSSTPDAEKQTEIGDGSPTLLVSALPNPMDSAAYPEGGLKAWTVVFGANLALIVSFGWINCEYSSFPGQCSCG